MKYWLTVFAETAAMALFFGVVYLALVALTGAP